MQLQIARLELVAAENRVAAVMDVKFTSHKTGQSLVMPYVEVYTVSEQKIRGLDVYPQDTARLVEFWNAN